MASGWSLRDLQAKIHNRVTAQAISQYERGESIPSDDVLRVLSQALGVSVAYLTGTSEIVLEGVEFRSKREIGRREQARIQARVLRRLERYLAVEEALRLPNLSWDRPRAAPFPMKGGLPGAEHAAGHVRAHWGLGITPVPNLAALLEDRGIKVVAMSLDTVDGMTARARQRHRGNQASYVIVVNGKKPGDRQRFTMAHELGHMVLEAPPGTAEKAAHQFAAAFLMPRDALLREVGWRRRSIGWSELFALQRMFRVSAQALTRRCEAVGVFRATLARRLYHEFARRHWSTYPFEEPVEIPRERPDPLPGSTRPSDANPTGVWCIDVSAFAQTCDTLKLHQGMDGPSRPRSHRRPSDRLFLVAVQICGMKHAGVCRKPVWEQGTHRREVQGRQAFLHPPGRRHILGDLHAIRRELGLPDGNASSGGHHRKAGHVGASPAQHQARHQPAKPRSPDVLHLHCHVHLRSTSRNSEGHFLQPVVAKLVGVSGGKCHLFS